MIDPVCKECKERTINCHADCDKYDHFRKEVERAKKYNKAKNEFDPRFSW